MDNNEFFVGYLPAPKGLARTMRWFAGVGILVALVLAGVLAWNQEDPGPGVWDVGNIVEIEGVLEVAPYPILYVGEENGPDRAVMLVSDIKMGVSGLAEPLHGQRVKARGNFISYDERSIFELESSEGALKGVDGAVSGIQRDPIGHYTLVGEIVDSKCFLGVMKPGYGKTHKACATRCISGGITPLFVTRAQSGEPTFYVLSDSAKQRVNEWCLPYIAEAVALEGEVERRGDLLHFSVAVDSIERR